ncbi:MAG TPA: hypothetical protein EYM43_00735 [Alphaproteobacteria bacterium]|nr:hypothetical protein [Alphaproteobacteria bacterium]
MPGRTGVAIAQAGGKTEFWSSGLVVKRRGILGVDAAVTYLSECGLASIYGFLQRAWPFGLVEAAWLLVRTTLLTARQKAITLF